jgi:hypothetical protein
MSELYVLNCISLGPSEYRDLGFVAITNVGDRLFGIDAAGVFELNGSDDDGTPISARVTTGLANLGQPTPKRVASASVRADPETAFDLHVLSGGRDGSYEQHTAEPSARMGTDPQLRTFACGRGVRAVYWGATIANKNGASLSLYNVNLAPVGAGIDR